MLVAAPLFLGSYTLGFVLDLCMSVALAESWLLLSGLTSYVSLGHAVFFGLGSYTMAIGLDVMPFWAAILLGGLASGLLAFVLGGRALKVHGPYFVILTLGLAELVKFVVITIESAIGNFGRILIDVPPPEVQYEIMLGLAVLAFVLVWWVQRSRFGTGLRAIREDESAAETIGIPTRRLKIAAYVLSAIIPGMVGAVMAMRSAYFEPTVAFSSLVSFGIVTTVIIEHVMRALMRLSDRILVVHHGCKVAEGLPEEVAHDPAVLAAYFAAGHHVDHAASSAGF